MLPIDLAYPALLPVSLAAGFVRGFSGFGGPLLMLPILTQYFTPADSIWISLLVDFVVNIQLLPEARRHASSSVLLPITLSAFLVMPAGVWLMNATEPAVMKRIIGVAILIGALLLLSGWKYRRQPTTSSWITIGLFSGLVFGATSLAVPLMLFLSAGNNSAAQVRANFIIWVFFCTIVLVMLLIAQGVLRSGNSTLIFALAPLYFVGAIAGARWQASAPERVVRICVLVLAGFIGGLSAAT